MWCGLVKVANRDAEASMAINRGKTTPPKAEGTRVRNGVTGHHKS